MKRKNLPKYEAIWEDFYSIQKQFPIFHLEDKVNVSKNNIVRPNVKFTHAIWKKEIMRLFCINRLGGKNIQLFVIHRDFNSKYQLTILVTKLLRIGNLLRSTWDRNKRVEKREKEENFVKSLAHNRVSKPHECLVVNKFS